MRTRFSVTCVHRDGERKLAMPALQARHMWDDWKETKTWLDACLAEPDNLDRLMSIYGVQAIGTFRVDGFDCYDHGDPIGWYPTPTACQTLGCSDRPEYSCQTWGPNGAWRGRHLCRACWERWGEANSSSDCGMFWRHWP